MTYENIVNEIAIEVLSINKQRVANKGEWLFINGSVGGVTYQYKGFNTYIQKFVIDGINHGGLGDISVAQYLSILRKAFHYHLVAGVATKSIDSF